MQHLLPGLVFCWLLFHSGDRQALKEALDILVLSQMVTTPVDKHKRREQLQVDPMRVDNCRHAKQPSEISMSTTVAIEIRPWSNR